MKLTDSFTQKAKPAESKTATRKQIRAAMHADAGYEEIFDLIAQQAAPSTYMLSNGDDLMIKVSIVRNAAGFSAMGEGNVELAGPLATEQEVVKQLQQYVSSVFTHASVEKIAQAGGPNMLAPQEAPEAGPGDVMDVTEEWPEQDISRQVQDLRTQGMDDGTIFKQLMEMQVLGTPSPMAQDLEYLNQVMKSAQQEMDPKRKKELEQIEQFKNKKKLTEVKPGDELAPDSSAPKPSEINMIDQTAKPPPGMEAPEPKAPPSLKDMPVEHQRHVVKSFMLYLADLQRKQSILLDEMLKADHPDPFGKSEVYTQADKQNLRKQITMQQVMISKAGSHFKWLRNEVGPEMLQSAQTQWLQEQLTKNEDPMDEYLPAGSAPADEMDAEERAERAKERKLNAPPAAPKSQNEKDIDKEERARQKLKRELKDKYPEDHPGHVPKPKNPKKLEPDAPGGEMDKLFGIHPKKKGQRAKLSPQQLKKMIQDHGRNDAFKAQPPPAGKPLPMRQPQMFDEQQMQNAPIDVDPMTPQEEIDEDMNYLAPARAAQVAPPAKPPAAPPKAPPAGGKPPPAPGAPPAAGPEGQPPIGPPSMDDDMGEDEPVEDMRSLLEVMEDLETDIGVLKEKLESGDSMLHGEEVEPVEDDTGALPAGPPKVAVDESAKSYYTKYYKDYGKQLTDGRVASIVDLIDEVGSHYGANLNAERVNAVTNYIASRPRHEVEIGDAKLTKVTDKIFINYLFKTGMVWEKLTDTAAAIFKNAIYNSGEAYKIAKYAEGKMKTPKPKGQPDDAVKIDKMKDKAEDSEDRVRPAHLKMEVVNSDHDQTYQYLEIEWDAKDASAECRSDAGMSQAVISFVKGLESKKEFKDMGYLGKIVIDEMDIDGGKALVHFRTQKLQGPLKTTKE